MAPFLHNVALPLFTVVGARATTNVCSTLAESNVSFRRALLVCGSSQTAAHAERIGTSLERNGLEVRLHRAGAATFREVDRLKREVIESFFPDLLIGVGGGAIIDVTKLAAAERRLPWISVPTSASNDGFCSPVAVLSSDRERKSVGASMPIGVLADLDLIAKAPRRLLLAGVGDLLSNISAVADWELAARQGKAAINHIARMLALAGPRQALACENPSLEEADFLRLVVEGLILSGLAMEVSGTSRPCSGAEHLISHALDAVNQGRGLHGEQVFIATLFCLSLHGVDVTPFQRLGEALGMPCSPRCIGLDRDQFLDAVARAPTMRLGRWTILSGPGVRHSAGDTYDACFGTDNR